MTQPIPHFNSAVTGTPHTTPTPRIALGNRGSRSLASSPASPTSSRPISPANPCRYTPAIDASHAPSPCAKSPAIIPASTSPVPADASAGFANGLTTAWPSARATTVCAPFKTTVLPHFRAASRAVPMRSRCTSPVEAPINLDISPG